MKDSFVFYTSFLEGIECLPQKYQLKAFLSIARYALFHEEPKEDGKFLVVFKMARPQIDATQKRYQIAAENGSKGGRPKKPNGFESGNLKEKEKDKDKNNDKDKYFQRPRRSINNYSSRYSGESKEDRGDIEAAKLAELLEDARKSGVDV